MIYVLEDDANIRKLVDYALTREGYSVEGFGTPAEFWAAVGRQIPQLVLLDIMLPQEDGLSVLQKLRSRSDTRRLPVIMLTARSSEFDKVTGLDSGADDYIAKPFRPRELVSRIKNALRRAGKPQAAVSLGDVRVDLERGACFRGDTDLCLSALEYRLLLTLINNRGHVLTRAQLLEHIWDIAGDFVNDNTLTVYIKRLREKLEADPQTPCIIKTVRGVGYKID